MTLLVSTPPQPGSDATDVVSPEVRTLAERVFHQLQSAIVRGELAPGSKITEPGLSKTYGISRGRCVRPCGVSKRTD